MNFTKHISPVRILRTVALVATVVASVAFVTDSASAGGGKPEYPLPEPKTTKIEIPGSLGGIHLGMTVDEVFEQWGDDAICHKTFCRRGSKKTALNKGYANVFLENGIVTAATIGWSPYFIDGERPIRRSLTKFETPEGIHLKSTAKEVKRAYPDAETVSPGNDLLYKFADDDATMYIEVGRLVETIRLYGPGFSFNGE